MLKNKNTYNPNQFISKTNHEQPTEKKDAKHSYDEIRKIVEHPNEKEILRKSQEKQIKKQVYYS